MNPRSRPNYVFNYSLITVIKLAYYSARLKHITGIHIQFSSHISGMLIRVRVNFNVPSTLLCSEKKVDRNVSEKVIR